MINVNQLNENIEELEKEIQNIKSVSRIYKEISKLSADVKVEKELHYTIIKDLTTVSQKINSSSSELANAIHKFDQVSTENKVILCDSLSSMMEDSKRISSQLIKEYKNYENEVSTMIFDITKQLSKQYDGFEENTNLRLESINRTYFEEIGLIKKIIDEYSKNINQDVLNQLENNERTIETEVKKLNNEIQNTLTQLITKKTENFEFIISEKQKTDQANVKKIQMMLGGAIFLNIVVVVLQIVTSLKL